MPLMRYFVFVGGALLALLLIANACFPALPETEAVSSSAAATDPPVIRIHSDRKWPERVVFDTSQPTVTPTPTPAPVLAEAVPAPPARVAPSLETGVRAAYAQVPTNRTHVEPARKRKTTVARNYNYYGQPRIVVAQQRSAFFFGNTLW